MSNKNFVLISGKSATGKTSSLRNLAEQAGVLFLNTEAGKELPFPAKFKKTTITNPLVVLQMFREAEKHDKIHTIVVDSFTYLMDLYESNIVLKANNKMEAWGNYGQYVKELFQQCVAESTKNIFFLAHTADTLNENEGIMETVVKVKGATMNNGVESYFNNVISSKKMKLKDLEDYKNPLLRITEEEEILGFKYVFQTRLTAKTVNERIRGPIGMWSREETYIDNDLQLVIDRLHEYYKEDDE